MSCTVKDNGRINVKVKKAADEGVHSTQGKVKSFNTEVTEGHRAVLVLFWAL
jgi:hypothetical protein